ncbi:hypothetical protein ACFV1W_20235 [Kitasatospora sp. NPDC059648]|uniref:hypothetical protein n=1 Tax=Kitasatospora sp. NPDC059648 TaxID=3346894 RepID=UPI00367CB245
MLSRRDHVVTATELTDSAHRFLAALVEGGTVRTAAAGAGLDEDTAAHLLHR